MNAKNWFVGCAACVILVAAWPAQAARAPKVSPEQAAKEALQAEAALVTAECKLTEDQQKTFQEKVKAKEAALETWFKANNEKLAAADEAVKQARTGTDAAAKKKANDDMKTLLADQARAAAEADAAILAILTPEQKQAWEGILLYQTTAKRYAKTKPTEEQSGRIKAACVIAAHEMSQARAKAPGDDRAEKKAKGDLEGKLRWAIENVILTPEQRDLVAKKPAARAAPAGQPGGTPPAAQPGAEAKPAGAEK